MLWAVFPHHSSYNNHSDENTIGIAGLILVAIQCFIMVASIYPTEKALKNHFNDDGTRK